MKTQLILTVAGTLVGLALVAWVQPSTGGATFLVALCVTLANAIGAVVNLGKWSKGRSAKAQDPGPPPRAAPRTRSARKARP